MQQLQLGPDKELNRQIEESTDFVASTIDAALTLVEPAAREHLHLWCNAIDFAATAATAPFRRISRSPRSEHSIDVPNVDAASVLSLLDTTTGSFCEKSQALRVVEWSSIKVAQRNTLAQSLVDHPDPEVRGIATAAFA